MFSQKHISFILRKLYFYRNIDRSKNVNERLQNEAGNYILEAAIILPIMIIGIISLLLAMKNYYYHWSVENLIRDEVSLSSSRACILYNDWQLRHRINSRLEELENIKEIYFNNRLDYSDGTKDSLIKISGGYKNSEMEKISYLPSGEFDVHAVSRKFVGDKKEYERYTLDEILKENGDTNVYVFPKDGERYHKAECRFVLPKANWIDIDSVDMKKYRKCKWCKPSKKGSVLIFEGYGDTFHKGDCVFIKRNTVIKRKDKAVEEGYTRCKVCNP